MVAEIVVKSNAKLNGILYTADTRKTKSLHALVFETITLFDAKPLNKCDLKSMGLLTAFCIIAR